MNKTRWMHTTSCTKNQLYNWLYETCWMHTTGCTTGCMKHIKCIQLVVQPVVQLAEWNTLNAYNQLYNQLYNWLNETHWMHTTGCTTSCTTGWMKHIECIQLVVQPVVQLAEWNTLNAYNRLYNQLYNWLYETCWMHTTGCTTSWMNYANEPSQAALEQAS